MSDKYTEQVEEWNQYHKERVCVLEFQNKRLEQDVAFWKKKAEIYEDGFNKQTEHMKELREYLVKKDKESTKAFMKVHWALIAIGIVFLFFPLYMWAIIGHWEWGYIAVTFVWMLSIVVNILALKRLRKQVKDDE